VSSKIILCVDDDLTVLRSLRDLLIRVLGSSVRVEIASNANEALELCAEITDEGNRVAVLISDFIMPRMRGDELLVVMHDMSPDTVKIMLTGQSDFEGVKNAINNANLYRFLEKPFNNADLIMTVKSALEMYSKATELVQQRKMLLETRAQLEQLISAVGTDVARRVLGEGGTTTPQVA
jgi:two-component system, sensor histidine kinase and response regulator